jgi:chromosome segregation ATPase
MNSFAPQQSSNTFSEQPAHRPTSALLKENSELNQLFAFYDFKLNEQKHQEQLMMNMLNQHFSKSLINEVEFKNLREQIRMYAQREMDFKNELATFEQRKGEFEIKYRELSGSYSKLKESIADLSQKNADLINENKMTNERYLKLKGDFEQLEKENEECVESLQKNLANENAAKKELQSKLKECHQKLAELEKQKEAIESKRKEIEAELEKCHVDLEANKGELKERTDEHEKLKVEHEKLKAILSYVKENYK